MALHFITYANSQFRPNAELLAAAALAAGFATARVWTPEDLAGTAFERENREILQRPRGAGYWLWKPYVIRETLRRVGDDDCVFYSDAGRTSYYGFDSYPAQLEGAARATGSGFLLGPAIGHLGGLSQWTKRDCLLLLDADTPDMLKMPLILATWGLWLPRSAAFDFLDLWLRSCRDRRVLTDDQNELGLPNHPDYRDHRHDQSVLTILAHRQGAAYLDLSSSLVQRLLDLRPRSELAHLFYKRAQNVENLLRRDNPLLLVREFLALRALRDRA